MGRYDCDDTRESGLEFFANCIEAIARARRNACADDDSCDPCPPRSRGDFLYDWVNLNVNYMTQAAHLASAYSVYAHRVLGALYGACAPVDRCREPESCLQFEGAKGDHVSRPFQVENCLDKEVPLEIEELVLRASDGNEKKPRVEYRLGDDDARGKRFKPGDRRRIKMRLDFAQLEPGERYTGRLTVRLGERKRRFEVVVCTLKS